MEGVMWRIMSGIVLGLLLIASPVLAVGPVVGTGCIVSWTAPTTDTAGGPLTGIITYDLALIASVAQPLAPPAAPSITGINGTDTTVLAAPPCRPLAAGRSCAYV